MALANNYAYLADSYGGFRVFDVSNPANPIQVSVIDELSIAFGVAVSGRYAYLADGGHGLPVYNILTPSTPSPAADITTTGMFTRVAISGRLALVCDLGDESSGFHILDATGYTALLVGETVTVAAEGGVGSVSFSAYSGETIRTALTGSEHMSPYGALTFPDGSFEYWPPITDGAGSSNAAERLLTQSGSYVLDVFDGNNLGGSVAVTVNLVQ